MAANSWRALAHWFGVRIGQTLKLGTKQKDSKASSNRLAPALGDGRKLSAANGYHQYVCAAVTGTGMERVALWALLTYVLLGVHLAHDIIHMQISIVMMGLRIWASRPNPSSME